MCKNNASQLKDPLQSEGLQITARFYEDYSAFKYALFEDLLQNNPDVDPLTLFKKSQKLLDRLLFIYFVEDRALFPPNLILSIQQKWSNLKTLCGSMPLYEYFKLLFSDLRSDNKGLDIFSNNSGLFAEDLLLDSLKISDEIFKKHAVKLSHYDFESEVSVDILGRIFEHSLAELEALGTSLKRSKKLNKRERKRNKGGVFYTPEPITAYLVEESLGRLCEEKKAELSMNDAFFSEIDENDWTQEKIEVKQRRLAIIISLEAYRQWLLSLKICDPACGSGFFLSAALRFLLAQHRELDRLAARVFASGLVFENIAAHIMENNLYGVDINEEAVEIAKLSLYLHTAHVGTTLSPLSNKLRCGNSLVSDPNLLPDAFNWQAAFPEVFEQGGFDLIITNPPYVQLQSMGAFSDIYGECAYESYDKMGDLYCLFYEKGVQLLKNAGVMAYITSNKWLRTEYGRKLRQYLVTKANPQKLIDLSGKKIFQDAVLDPNLLILKKEPYTGETLAMLYKGDRFDAASIIWNEENIYKFGADSWLIMAADDRKIMRRMQKHAYALKDLPITINYGIKTGYNDAFYLDEATKDRLIAEDPKSAEIIVPLLRGRDIRAYAGVQTMWMLFVPWHFPLHLDSSVTAVSVAAEKLFQKNYPAVYQHLLQHKEALSRRNKVETEIRYEWYALQRWGANYYQSFQNPKIIYPNMTTYMPFMFDERGMVINDKAFMIVAKSDNFPLLALCAILNSNLAKTWIKCHCPDLGSRGVEIRKVYFEHFPVVDFSASGNAEILNMLETLGRRRVQIEANLTSFRRRFMHKLRATFKNIEETSTFERFLEFKFSELKKALAKQKIKLSIKEKDAWEDYLKDYRTRAQQFVEETRALDEEIETKVRFLYGVES